MMVEIGLNYLQCNKRDPPKLVLRTVEETIELSKYLAFAIRNKNDKKILFSNINFDNLVLTKRLVETVGITRALKGLLELRRP